MRTFKMTYKNILFILWTLVFLYIVLITYGSLKDIYFLLIIINLPISLIGTYIIDTFQQNYILIIIIGYISGLIQWVFLVGGLMDRFLPKINFNFNLKISLLTTINKYIFVMGLFGFILSLVTIQQYLISAVIYNISLAFVVSSIGIKVLFLEKK